MPCLCGHDREVQNHACFWRDSEEDDYELLFGAILIAWSHLLLWGGLKTYTIIFNLLQAVGMSIYELYELLNTYQTRYTNWKRYQLQSLGSVLTLLTSQEPQSCWAVVRTCSLSSVVKHFCCLLQLNRTNQPNVCDRMLQVQLDLSCQLLLGDCCIALK